VERTVLGAILISTALILLVGWAFPWIVPLPRLRPYADLIRLYAVGAAASHLSAFFYQRCAAHENFRDVSIIETVGAFTGLVLILVLSYFGGLTGAVTAHAVSATIVCLLAITLNVRAHGPVAPTFNARHILAAVAVGFPISLVWWIFTLQTSVDRVVCASLLGSVRTGYYGIGISLATLLVLIPRITGRVLYPGVNRAIGQSADTHALHGLVVRPTLALAVLIPLSQAGFLCVLPLILGRFVPQYLPGLRAAQILVLGAFFLGLTRNGANYLIATDRQGTFLRYVIVCLVVNLAVNLVVVHMGYGIEGVAVSTMLAGFLLSTMIWRRVFHGLGRRGTEQLTGLLQLYAPFVILLAALVLARAWVPQVLSEGGLRAFAYAAGLPALVLLGILALPAYRTEIRHWPAAVRRRGTGIDGPEMACPS